MACFSRLHLVSIQSFSVVSKYQEDAVDSSWAPLQGKDKLVYTVAPAQSIGFFIPLKFRVSFLLLGVSMHLIESNWIIQI